MAAGDIKTAYGTKTSITCTITSLTNGSARASAVIDNTTDKFRDAIVRIKTNGQSGGTASLRVYAYAALNDTTYTDGVSGSDEAATVRNAVFVGAVSMNAATGVIAGPFSIASAFAGVLPPKWGVIISNGSGATLSATGADHVIEYQGVYDTVASA